MSPHAEMATTLDRIATATSVIRTRSDDAARLIVHGGTPAELHERVRNAAVRLEQIAAELVEGLN